MSSAFLLTRLIGGALLLAGASAVLLSPLDFLTSGVSDQLLLVIGLALSAVSLFASGFIIGRRSVAANAELTDDGGVSPPVAVSPEEARYWLERFLREQQTGESDPVRRA